MSFREWFYKLTFPLSHWTIGRQVFWDEDWLTRTQFWPDEARDAARDISLRDIIREAYENTKYYREIMDGLGLKPDDIFRAEDLRKLPILSKDTLRERLDDISVKERGALYCGTSGSTGAPVHYWRSKRQLEIAWAATMRGLGWAGWQFGEPSVRLWHQTVNMTPVQVVKEKLDAWLSNRRFIPMYWLDDEWLMRGYKLIRDSEAVLLDGYSDALVTMAQFVKRKRLRPLRVKGIVSTAAVLSDENRALLEQYLGGKVFDKYGAREFSGVGWECELHDGYHVVGEQLIVEIVGRDGQPVDVGETGRVVVTDLWNTATPFIRYDLGDEAVNLGDGGCACGRNLPKIGKLCGRVQGNIRGANGRVVPAGFWEQVFREEPVSRFRVEQHKLGEVTVFITPLNWDAWPQVGGEMLRVWEHELRSWLGDMAFRWRIVSEDEMPRSRSGKFVTALSTLSEEEIYGGAAL